MGHARMSTSMWSRAEGTQRGRTNENASRRKGWKVEIENRWREGSRQIDIDTAHFEVQSVQRYQGIVDKRAGSERGERSRELR
eukprot:309596-Rhodomonas_salina.1